MDETEFRVAKFVGDKLAGFAVKFAISPKASLIVIERLGYLMTGQTKEAGTDFHNQLSTIAPSELDVIVLRAVADVVERLNKQSA
jgi:hypothetical protein